MIVLSRCLENDEIFKDLIMTVVYFTSFTVFFRDIKTNQSTGHFQSYFFSFFGPPDPKSE